MRYSRLALFLIIVSLAVAPQAWAVEDRLGDRTPDAAERPGEADAADESTSSDDSPEEAVVPPMVAGSVAEETSAETEGASEPGPVPENSVARCEDGVDNDGDSHLDCDDQDCQIFAICVTSPKEETPQETSETPRDGIPATPPVKRRPFSVGFFPGVSTDGGAEGIVLNHFTLNFIGMGDMLRGAEMSMLGAIRLEDVTGYQSAGLFNVNLGITRGYQAAGLMNFTRRDFSGFQGAGITSLTLERFDGFQAAGIFNLTREMNGFQGAGISNVALGDVRGFQGAGISNFSRANTGFQGAGITNIALGDAKGFQGSGIANVSRANTGFQGAGITNIALRDTTGFQGSGIANVAVGNSRGLQAAGIANVATGEVRGAQIGLVNFGAKVKGAQIGLVNIATEEMKGASIGLVNYAGDGIFAPTFWMADSSMLNLGLKTGSKHVYGIVGAGAHPVKKKRFSLVAGIGGHIELKRNFWVEIDLLHNTLEATGGGFGDYEVDFIEQARVHAGYRFGNQFSVYVGPSLNLLVSEEREAVGFIPAMVSGDEGDTHIALSLGLTAGIQWEPRFARVNAWD